MSIAGFSSSYLNASVDSIQFIVHSPKSQIYNLYTYDIPVPGPHIGSGETPPKKLKNTFRGEKRRATEEYGLK